MKKRIILSLILALFCTIGFWCDNSCESRLWTLGIIFIISFVFVMFSIQILYIVFNRFDMKISIKAMLVFIIIEWLIYITLCYPASSIPFDSFYMIDEIYGFYPKTNAHPFLSVMLIGYAMKIGTFLGNNNLGIFIYILFQTVIFYLGLIQNVFLMKKWDVKDRFIKLMLVLYIILPVYFVFCAVDRKDVLYSAFILLYTGVFINEIKSLKVKIIDLNFLMMNFYGLLCVLLRHNGLAIVLISQIFLIVYNIAKKCNTNLKRNIYTFISVLFLYMLFNKVVYPQLGVGEIEHYRSYATMNSLRFQQTAAYIDKHSDELESNEVDLINKMFRGGVERIRDYQKDNGDYMMLLTYFDRESYIEREYNKFWFKSMLKDPFVYFKAHMEYVYRYYYPFSISDNSLFTISTGYANTGEFNIFRSKFSNRFCSYMNNIFWGVAKIPIIKAVLSPAFYMWIFMGFLIWSILSKNAKCLIALGIPFVQIIINLMGLLPVNGALHYAYSFIILMPFLLAFILNEREETLNEI